MSSVQRTMVCLALLLPAPWAGAQGTGPGRPVRSATRTLTVSVPQPGEYILRILPSPELAAAEELPTSFGDKRTTVTLDPAKLGKQPRIAVDDVRTGNTAVAPIPPGDTLELRTADFRFVRRIDVKVTYQGKALKTAQVTLTPSEGGSRVQAIDPFDQGTAMFQDVPSGPAKVQVRYGEGATVTHAMPIHTDHPAGVLVLPIAVSTAAPTLDEAPPAGETAQPLAGPGTPAPAPAPPERPGGAAAGVVNAVVGLAVVVGVGYGLYRWAQSGGMAATLKKAGIEVDGPPPGSDAGTPWQPAAAKAPVVADPNACQFCGQVKDASGACACTVAPGAAAAAPAPGGLRLVGTMGTYAGSVHPLTSQAPITVGREPTNDIALPDDTTVSRRHATLRVEAGVLTVTDEESSNGVYINGARIAGAQTARPGDEVQIGSTRFRLEA